MAEQGLASRGRRATARFRTARLTGRGSSAGSTVPNACDLYEASDIFAFPAAVAVIAVGLSLRRHPLP